MIISFYIFSVVFILSNAEINRVSRQTDEIQLTSEESLPDIIGSAQDDKVSYDGVYNNSNEIVQPIIENVETSLSNAPTDENTQTSSKKVKKVKRVKVHKKLLKTTAATPTESTIDPSLLIETTEAISDLPSTEVTTTTEIPLTTNPTKTLKKFTKTVPKFAPKRRTLPPRPITETSLDTQTTESSTIAVTETSTSEATTQVFDVTTVTPTESSSTTSSEAVTPTTQVTSGYRKRLPTGRLIAQKTLSVQQKERPALEGDDNKNSITSTIQTYFTQNNAPTTESAVRTTPVEVTTTTQSSYASRRRRPTSSLVAEITTVTPSTEGSSFISRSRRPTSRFSTEKPLDIQVTQTPAPLLIRTPPVPTIQTYANNQWNVIAQDTTKFFNPTLAPVVSEVTPRTFASRGQSNFWRSTEKPSVVTEGNYLWKESTQPTWFTQTSQTKTTVQEPVASYTSRGQSNYWRSTEKPAVVTESNYLSRESTKPAWYTQSPKKTTGQDPFVPIVDLQNYVYSNSGNFHYSYEGADGTKAFEKGALKNSQFSDGAGQAVEGNFSYKDKDGNDINLSYTADENGYRPVGAHLPTPPPIPPAIQRVLAILATKTTPEPVTEKFKAY